MKDRDEHGFTLIEIVIVVAVLGILMSAITSALIVSIRTIGSTSSRISQSHDAQLLSTWLVADLQSTALPTGYSVVDPSPLPAGTGDCPLGTTPFTQLRLSWTDAESNFAYMASYDVDATGDTLRRTLSVNGVAQPSFVVVRHLADPAPTQPLPPGAVAKYPTCVAKNDATGKITVTITTLINANVGSDNYQFTFSVSGQTRQAHLPPPPTFNAPAPPKALDTNDDGKVDTVEVQFDQLVACEAGCDRTKWELTGVPGAGTVTPQSVVLKSDNKSVELTLPPAGITVDTAAIGMQVGLVAGSIRGAGGPATFAPVTVADRMGPLLVSATSRDNAPLGTLDQVVIAFSEPVAAAPDRLNLELLNGPDGNAQPATVAAGPSSDQFVLGFTTATPDTVAALAEIEIAGGAVGDGTTSNVAKRILVADGMAPVLSSLVADQASNTGRITRMVATFSEPVTGTPSVTHNGGAVTTTPASAGSTMTLTLTGAPVDTSTLLYAISGSVSDGRGNTTPLASPIQDRVGPVLVGVTTTVPGSTIGRPEANDVLTLTFSEALAAVSVPSSLTMSVSESGPRTTFTLPGLAVVVMEANDYTNNAGQTCTANVGLSASASVVTATMTTCGASTFSGSGATGAPNPVTPTGATTDQASPANAAAGGATLPNGSVLF